MKWGEDILRIAPESVDEAWGAWTKGHEVSMKYFPHCLSHIAKTRLLRRITAILHESGMVSGKRAYAQGFFEG